MKTVRVRIAVAVTSKGEWHAEADFEDSEKEAHQRAVELLQTGHLEEAECAIHWVEADIPIPEGVTVEGEVVK